MWKRILKFFDKLEDRVRGKLSHYPIFYGFLGGIGVVLFWRGVWYVSDELNIGSIASIALGSLLLLITGVFVSAFIGNRLIISGLKGEEKLNEKEEAEIALEEAQIKDIQDILNKVETKVSHLEEDLHERQ